VRALRSLHDFRQHPLHIAWVHEEDQGAVCADARLAEHALALAFEPLLGHVDVRHLVADVVLSPLGVLVEKAFDARVAGEGFDQFDLRARCAVAPGCIDKADLDALLWQIEGRVNVRGTHDVPIECNAVGDRWSRYSDMVQTAKLHGRDLDE